MTNHFKGRSVNIDDQTWQRCAAVARELGTSNSGAIRILISHFLRSTRKIRKRQDGLRSKALEPQI